MLQKTVDYHWTGQCNSDTYDYIINHRPKKDIYEGVVKRNGRALPGSCSEFSDHAAAYNFMMKYVRDNTFE